MRNQMRRRSFLGAAALAGVGGAVTAPRSESATDSTAAEPLSDETLNAIVEDEQGVELAPITLHFDGEKIAGETVILRTGLPAFICFGRVRFPINCPTIASPGWIFKLNDVTLQLPPALDGSDSPFTMRRIWTSLREARP